MVHSRSCLAFASPNSLVSNAIPTTRQNKMRIFCNRRQPSPVRHFKPQPLSRNHCLDLLFPMVESGSRHFDRSRPAQFLSRRFLRRAGLRREKSLFFFCTTQSLRQSHQPALKLPTQNRRHPKRPQILRIHRRVQPITTNMRPSILLPQRRNQFASQPRSRMHRQINRNQLRRPHHSRVQPLPRQIKTSHPMPAPPQPSRRRHQPKRLPPQLISRNQHSLHLPPV